MIILHFENLRFFIFQYILATLGGSLIYYYLGRGSVRGTVPFPIIRKVRNLGNSEYQTPLRFTGFMGEKFLILQPGLFTESLVGYWNETRFFFDITPYYINNGYPSNCYGPLSSVYEKSPEYQSTTVYQIYRIMVAVSAWAGILLLISPFKYIYVFLPHFSDPYNIVVAIVLAIAIFEGVLSTIFFRIGVSFTRILLVISLVIVAFTLSILTPSMSWLDAFSINGRLEIYFVLMAMFVAITALISQLRTKRNLFLSSLLFSTVAYFSFVGIVLYNVLQFL